MKEFLRQLQRRQSMWVGGFHEFLIELKRRRLLGVAGFYVTATAGLIQFIGATPWLGLPYWAAPFAFTVLALMFLPVLLATWFLAGPDNAAVKAAYTAVDYVLAAVVVVIVAVLGVAQLGRSSAVSVAVLPFVNLSGDASEEHFSDGITEEITAALASIPSLRVVARTSSFKYKGERTALPTVGRELNASHLIEGSIRKAGNRFRITAQLIRAADDLHLWAQSYDRDQGDLVAIQEDIARRIAAELRGPLGLAIEVKHRPVIDGASYEDYLRARSLVRLRGRPEPNGPLTQAASLLENVVQRNPDYSPAWTLLAQTYGLVAAYGSGYFTGPEAELRAFVSQWLPRAEEAAKRAVALDPTSANAHASLAFALNFRGQLLTAEDQYLLALEIDRENTDVLHLYSLLLGSVGRVDEALAIRRRLQILEPFVPIYDLFTANHLWLVGQDGAALTILRALPAENGFVGRQTSLLYASQGKLSDAAAALLKVRDYDPNIIKLAIALISADPSAAAKENRPPLAFLSLFYVYAGEPVRALDYFDANLKAGLWAAADALQFWHPSFASLRGTDRFKEVMRSAGLPEYWRERGWPVGCGPSRRGDFACDLSWTASVYTRALY